MLGNRLYNTNKMEIKTKYDKKEEVYFMRNGEIRKEKIVGIQIIYGLYGACVTPFVKIEYHFKIGLFNRTTFTIEERFCFSSKGNLLDSIAQAVP